MDARFLRQPAREGYFGQTVASLGDQNSDGVDEIMISAPRNERYLADALNAFGGQGTHWASTIFRGSITVLPGINYNDNDWLVEAIRKGCRGAYWDILRRLKEDERWKQGAEG